MEKRTRSNLAEQIHHLPDELKRFFCPLSKDLILQGWNIEVHGKTDSFQPRRADSLPAG